ncbi:unnamed protein product [Cladocopium goreaui]|uniref:Pentatricopeptide repeat-containing protein n=1 Tax=Cladocopium goreaui TaxID=2562237 RepID=A0A9P1DGC8_9DINO|nr:unnamed protein product [Cladocopium goreaui]
MRRAKGSVEQALLSLQKRSSGAAYSIAISVLQKNSQWQKALDLFQDYQAAGVRSSSPKVHNAALGAACAGLGCLGVVRAAADHTARPKWCTAGSNRWQLEYQWDFTGFNLESDLYIYNI